MARRKGEATQTRRRRRPVGAELRKRDSELSKSSSTFNRSRKVVKGAALRFAALVIRRRQKRAGSATARQGARRCGQRSQGDRGRPVVACPGYRPRKAAPLHHEIAIATGAGKVVVGAPPGRHGIIAAPDAGDLEALGACRDIVAKFSRQL